MMKRLCVLLGLLLCGVPSIAHAQIAQVGSPSSCDDFSAGSPVSSLTCAHTVPGTTFTDTFNRADNTDLGVDWDSGYVPGVFVNLQIVGNAVRSTSTTQYAFETFNAASSIGNDQYTKLTIKTFTGGGFIDLGALVRASAPPTDTSYLCHASQNAFGSTASIQRGLAGSYTDLITTSSVTWGNGDTLECQVVGQAITLLRNGSIVLTTTDGTIASGRPGISLGSDILANVEIETFETGSMAGGQAAPLMIVGVVARDITAGDVPISGVTYNGVALTKACERTFTGGTRTLGSSLWYIQSAASGAHNVVATPTGAVEELALATTLWSGVNQASPLSVTCVSNGGYLTTSGIMSTNVTTTSNGQVILDATMTTAQGIAYSAPQVTIRTAALPNGSDNDSLAFTYKAQSIAGGTSMTETASGFTSGVDYFTQAAIALRPAQSLETLTWSEASTSTAEFNIERAFRGATAFHPLQTITGGAGNFTYISGFSTEENRCYRVNARNAVGTSPYSNIASAPGFQNTISPLTQPNGTVGVVYAGSPVTITESCVPPVIITATNLPPGITLSTSGVWSGSPTVAGTYLTTVTATDSNIDARSNSISYTITIASATIISLSPSSQPTGTVGTTYAGTTVTASGGTGPYTFVCSGCPPGVTLSSGGVWGGVPTTPGTFSVTVTATDSGSASGNIGYSIVINPQPATVVISTTSEPAGVVGVAYVGTNLTSTGGTPPYTYTSSNRPPGISLSSGGVWSGTPTTAGTYATLVTVTDSAGSPNTSSKTFNILINPVPPPLTLSPSSQPSGTVGSAYSGTTMSATGGTSPYTWVAAGLPAGVTLSSAGVWGGTPTTAGTFSVTVTATDSTSPGLGGPVTGTKIYSILINPSVAISLSPAIQPPGVVGFVYTGTTVTASGGTGPYTFAQTGCPTGIAISSGGVWSGTPTVAGTFDCSVTATDSLLATGNIHYIIGIAPVLTISPLTQPQGFVNATYAGTPLTASGGTAPYAFVASGLPPGISLTSLGTWVGAPTTAGDYTVQVTVTDSTSPNGQQNIAYSIHVNAALPTQTPVVLSWSYSGRDTAGALEFPITWTIEQSTDREGVYTQIALIDAVVNNRLVTSYTVASPPSPIGCWRIRATDQSGNTSLPSSPFCKSTTIQYTDITPPSAPTSLTGTQ